MCNAKAEYLLVTRMGNGAETIYLFPPINSARNSDGVTFGNIDNRDSRVAPESKPRKVSQTAGMRREVSHDERGILDVFLSVEEDVPSEGSECDGEETDGYWGITGRPSIKAVMSGSICTLLSVMVFGAIPHL